MKNERILISTAILALLPMLSYASGSSGRGGGHFVFSADGSVQIADNYYHNQVIVPTVLPASFQRSVKKRANDLIAVGLSDIQIKGKHGQISVTNFSDAFDSALYYFVDVIPQVADCGLKVDLALPSGATIDLAACTSGSHTFIKTADWQSADFDTQIQLLLHERLRQFSGENTANSESEVMTIVQASNLIEKIHDREAAAQYLSLSLPEMQLLENSRRAVVDLAFLRQVPNCLASNSDYMTCFADTTDFAVTPNGGGILLRSNASNIPESSYFGVGSLDIAQTQTFGEYDRVVGSVLIVDQCVLEDHVSLTSSKVSVLTDDAPSTDLWTTPVKNLIFKTGSSLDHDDISVFGENGGENQNYGKEVSLFGVLQPGQTCHYMFNVLGPIQFSLPENCK
jgi:hypothetical protein